MSGGKLLAVVLFGSVARGDDDGASDLDVLGIVESRSGRVPEDEVRSKLPIHLQSRQPDISWYGSDRFREMSLSGQLFAWHIYLDGKIVFDPTGYIERLGAPSRYTRAIEDIDAFMAIADGVVPQVEASAHNAVYEMGVLYVCIRNVAMSGSWHVADRPDFTRDSPFHIKPSLAQFGISQAVYHQAMACRQASQRGTDAPPLVTGPHILELSELAGPWMSSVRAECARLTSCN